MTGDPRVWIWRDSHHYPQVAFRKPSDIHPSVEYVRAEKHDRALWLLRQVLQDMPSSRDWLNPDIEREIRSMVL